MSMKNHDAHRPFHVRTLAVHGGQTPDEATGAIAPPIVTTSSYSYGDFDNGVDRFTGEKPGFLYSRFANPTVAVLEAKMAALEGGEAAVGFASGMAAISSTLLALLSAGDDIVTVGTLYGGTQGVIGSLLPRLGIQSNQVSRIEDLAAAMTPCTQVVYVETPANPVLGIVDLAETARIAHEFGAIVVADNTFATPCLTQPLALGVDIVVHSATKFISGHGDATGGIAVGTADAMRKVRQAGMMQLGSCLSPHDASMLIRGLKTMPLRVEASSASAQRIAEFLDGHDAISAVHYPGLPGHPGHDVAARQMSAFGGILSLEMKGGRSAARSFLDALTLVTQAVSVGDTDSLACHPATTTHSAVPTDIRKKSGVTDGLVRLSVGIEFADDLLDDIQQALTQI
jgi:methionine-gamma-lyase